MDYDFLIVSQSEDSEPDLVRAFRGLEPDSTVLHAKLRPGRFPQQQAQGSITIEVDGWIGSAGPFFDGIGMQASRAGSSKLIAVGYSENANHLAALAACTGFVADGAILLRPTATFDRVPPKGTCTFPLLILSGTRDPIMAPSDAAFLGVQLSMAGAEVTHRQLQAGHGLSRHDQDACMQWLQQLRSRDTLNGSWR